MKTKVLRFFIVLMVSTLSCTTYGQLLSNLKDKAKNKMGLSKQTKLPDVFSEPEKSLTDPELTMFKLDSCIMANEDYSNIIQKITKIHIGSKIEAEYGDWRLLKNDGGLPRSKCANREVYIIFKGKDDACYFSSIIYFVKDYTGVGTFDPVRVGSKQKNDVVFTKIACENIPEK